MVKSAGVEEMQDSDNDKIEWIHFNKAGLVGGCAARLAAYTTSKEPGPFE